MLRSRLVGLLEVCYGGLFGGNLLGWWLWQLACLVVSWVVCCLLVVGFAVGHLVV